MTPNRSKTTAAGAGTSAADRIRIILSLPELPVSSHERTASSWCGYPAVVFTDARPAPVVLGSWPTPLEPRRAWLPRLAWHRCLTSGLGDLGPDLVGDGGQLGHERGVLGPPGERHRAWRQVANRHESHARAFVPLANRLGGDAQARARRDEMGLGVQGRGLGDHRRRA